MAALVPLDTERRKADAIGAANEERRGRVLRESAGPVPVIGNGAAGARAV